MVPQERHTATLEAILETTEYVVAHFDAEWDNYAVEVRRELERARSTFPDVTFSYVDVDMTPELAKHYSIINVPTVIYFRYGERIASIVGRQQDIVENIRLLRSGKTPAR